MRLVAAPLRPDQAQQARQRKQRKARKRGRRPAASTSVVAGWLLVLTTLDARDGPAEAVLRLYRARWQGELVVKRCKQLLGVRPLRCRRRDVAEATVRALLIAWVLQERLTDAWRQALADDQRCPVSSWRVCHLSLAMLRQEGQGQWTRARLRARLPQLRRFLCSSPRWRTQQEIAIRNWLHQRAQATWLATAA